MRTTYHPIISLLLVVLLSATANAQDTGRVTPASLPLPLPSDAPLPPDVLRSNNPWNQPMTGTWRFSLTHGHINDAKQYVSEDIDFGNAQVIASGSQGSDMAANAFDGDPATLWRASDATYPQWIAADLGQNRHITGATLAWENTTDLYQFRLEGSSDGRNWSTLADRTKAPGVGGGPVTVSSGDFRYVRMTITGGSSANGVSIRDIRLRYLDNNGQDSVWLAALGQPSAASAPNPDGFAIADYDDSAWKDIVVPSNWEMLGYSLPTYNNVDNTVGLYRRTVNLPAAWAGKDIYWRFDGALDGTEIFVNGQKVGYHESGYTAFDVDLTGLVQPGKPNFFAVRVSKTTPSYDCDTGDFQSMGGIYRDTSLIAVPTTHVSDITLRTPLSADYKDATINADIKVVAPASAAVQLTARLTKIDGKQIGTSFTGSAIAGADGIAEVQITSPVVAPALWSAEKPNLYYLVLQLNQGGKVIEKVEQRFGFKQIDIVNNVVLWNGVPIKCEGTCRHDFWADKGFALSDTEWNKDLSLMKAANINAIRTSHYNHAERFLELCEEKGMYVLDEVPFCWIGNKINDTSYAPYLLQRTQETLERDKNRPCVLAWSLGNENGYGQNEQPVFDLVKQIDPTRPAFVSQQGPDQIHGQEWLDRHYPSPDDVDRDAKNTKLTADYSESPHTFSQKEAQAYDPGVSDLWSEALDKLWQKIWADPTILGSFIWEWQNQGVADQNTDTWSDFYYGRDRLRDENNKGIVDSYRNPKPEWWIVKVVYSPVGFGVRTVNPVAGQFTVPLTNHYSFTDLSELTCKWTASNGGTVLQTGSQHIACPPLQSVQASFPAQSGATQLRLEFDHADGTNVIAANFAVDGAPQPAAPAALAAGSAMTTTDSTDTLTIANDASTIVFDKQTGLVKSWTAHGKLVLIGGPVVNIGDGNLSNDGDYYRVHQAPATQDAAVTSAPPDAEGAVSVTVASSLLDGPTGNQIGNLKCVYDICRNAEIHVKWILNWTAPNTKLWEDGLKFILPGISSKLTWLRDSYFLDYPDGHIGEPYGTASPTDPSYVASKRNLHWLTLLDGLNTGIALLQDAQYPLVGRALVDASGVNLFASAEVAGPRDLSGNWVADHDIHATQDTPLEGSLILRAIAP